MVTDVRLPRWRCAVRHGLVLSIAVFFPTSHVTLCEISVDNCHRACYVRFIRVTESEGNNARAGHRTQRGSVGVRIVASSAACVDAVGGGGVGRVSRSRGHAKKGTNMRTDREAYFDAMTAYRASADAAHCRLDAIDIDAVIGVLAARDEGILEDADDLRRALAPIGVSSGETRKSHEDRWSPDVFLIASRFVPSGFISSGLFDDDNDCEVLAVRYGHCTGPLGYQNHEWITRHVLCASEMRLCLAGLRNV